MNEEQSKRVATGGVPHSLAATGDEVTLEVVPESSTWPWRWRNYVLIPDQCALPPFCATCGESTDRSMRVERVKWFSPALFAFMPLSIPVMISGQKNGHVFYTLCEKHDGRRTTRFWVAWALGIAAVAQFLASVTLMITLQVGWPVFMVLTAFFTLLAAVAIPALMPGVLRVHRIANGIVWLRLMPTAFYEHLPQLPSADGRTPIIPPYELADG